MRSLCVVPFVLVAVVLALAACGGSGGGPVARCTRWQPSLAVGPGDALAHLPLAVGNRWVTRGSPSGAPPWTWEATEVTGTQVALGRQAWVLTTMDLDTGAPSGRSYVGKDEHGVLDLGNDSPADPLTPQVVPYYPLRFPISVGDQFTSLDCTNLDFGSDLDGDGRNERIDLRVVVAVEAVEPVETGFASFPEAARVTTRQTATVHGSRSGATATVDGLQTRWYAPGVGPVRELDELPIGSLAPEERLVGYRVGGALRGLVERRALAIGSFSGPVQAAAASGRWLIAGRAASELPVSSRAVALLVEAGGAAGQPFALIDVTAPPSPIPDVSSPSVVAAGGGVLAVAGNWTGTAGDVRVQRVDAAGALLEDPAGRVLANASSSNPGFGGGPRVASDGTGFLVVWCEVDRMQAIRLDASAQVVGVVQTLAGPTGPYLGPGSAVVSFDGTRYLVLYQWLGAGAGQELRALHMGTDGIVEESNPLILSDQPGTKQVLAAVFDGTQHLLVMVDGRDPAGTVLTLRRLSPAGAFLDGDAATGGLVLSLAVTASASLTFDGSVTFVSWADGNAIRLARITPAGDLLDAEGGRPGVLAVDADFPTRVTLDWPIALPAGGGALELVYLATDSLRIGPPVLWGVLMGL